MTAQQQPAAATAGTAEPRPPRWLGVALIVLGLASIVAGAVALAYPDITLLVISLIFGINLIVYSVVDLIDVFTGHELDVLSRTLGAILAMIGLVAGLIVLRHPFNSLAVIILALGIYLVVAGAVGAVRAIGAHAGDRAARMLTGIAVLAVGVLILSLPGLSLATLALLTGLGMIARGVMAIVAGFGLRHLAHHPPTAQPVS